MAHGNSERHGTAVKPTPTRYAIPPFWQAMLIISAAYLVFTHAFPPVMPRSLLIPFMLITIVGVLLYYSCDDARWEAFKSPIIATLTQEDRWLLRWALLILIPGFVTYTVYAALRPSIEAPLEPRQIHPAPPPSLKVFDQRYDLTTLKNPLRNRVLEQFRSGDEAGALETHTNLVATGRDAYFRNCVFCHGSLLNGESVFPGAFNPQPTNFRGTATIAQLQESYLFWRITTGGPGLPTDGAPWNSAMPAWTEMLTEQEVWAVILFLYDYVGQVPRMWDQEESRLVTAIRDAIEARRARMTGNELYQLRCAACHGEDGTGDGPAADFLYPRPRDFSTAVFKYKSSPGALPPRDEDLFEVIKFGLNNTSMPGWATVLTDDQIRSLIPVIKRFDFTGTWAPPDAEDEDFDDEGHYLKDDFVEISEREPLDGQVSYSETSVASGREVFKETCVQCHGEAGRGNVTADKRLADDWGYRVWPRDFGKPWTWRLSTAVDRRVTRDQTIRMIYQRLSIGLPGTPMPSHRGEAGAAEPITLEQRWHVANYVYSLREGAAPPPGTSPLIVGTRITGRLPDRVDDPRWEQGLPVTLRLAPNLIKDERLFRPLNDAITVRVLYDDEAIGFLLEISDRTDSRPGEVFSELIQDEQYEMSPDAFAIQFPKQNAYTSAPLVEKPHFGHGDAAHPTTIWYWNAGSIEPEIAPTVVLLDAGGLDRKPTPRDDDHSLSASGAWEQGRWRVIMTRPRAGNDRGDIAFQEGRILPVAFANWDGSNGEAGSRHTLTAWCWLLLPAEVDRLEVYGWPLGSGSLVFLAGWVIARHQRRAKRHGAA